MNQLMKIYLRENRLEETEQLLSYPVCPLSISTNNPNIILQLGTYYYHRAEYFVAVGDLQKGISDFLESALHFRESIIPIKKKNALITSSVAIYNKMLEFQYQH